MSEITIQHGLPEAHREAVGRLFFEATSEKLGWVFRSEEDGHAGIAESLQADCVIVALEGETLLGAAALKTANWEALGFSRIQSQHFSLMYVLFGMLVSAIFGSKAPKGTLLVDLIAVGATQRGKGIGTRLLGAAEQYARDNGFTELRLSVIDENPRAQALYERMGYVVIRHTAMPFFLRPLFGFSGAADMCKPLNTES